MWLKITDKEADKESVTYITLRDISAVNIAPAWYDTDSEQPKYEVRCFGIGMIVVKRVEVFQEKEDAEKFAINLLRVIGADKKWLYEHEQAPEVIDVEDIKEGTY